MKALLAKIARLGEMLRTPMAPRFQSGADLEEAMNDWKVWTDEEKNWSVEAIYDAEISPLMARILEICKRNKIPMLATFQYQDGEKIGGPGYCTSKLLFSERPPTEQSKPFLRFVHSWPERPVMLTETHVTNPDGSKVIKIGRVG